jgi:hypothetical protein
VPPSRGALIGYTTGQNIADGMRVMMVKGSATLEKPYTVDQLEASLAVYFGVKPEPPRSN